MYIIYRYQRQKYNMELEFLCVLCSSKVQLTNACKTEV